MKIPSLRLFAYLIVAFGSILQAADDSGSVVELQRQISDFRLLLQDMTTLKQKEVREVCTIEAIGRVRTKGGAPLRVYEFSTTNRPSVGDIFQKLEIATNTLSGIQIRLFQKNMILQTGRTRKTQAADLPRLWNVRVSAGDILYFTAEE